MTFVVQQVYIYSYVIFETDCLHPVAYKTSISPYVCPAKHLSHDGKGWFNQGKHQGSFYMLQT